jgi:hypothetical protein
MKEFVGQNTEGVKKIPLHDGCFIFKRKKDNRIWRRTYLIYEKKLYILKPM